MLRPTQVSETLSEDDLTFEITSETPRVTTHGLTSASFGGPTSKYGCYVPPNNLEALACEMRVPPSDSWGAVEAVQPTGDPPGPPRKKLQESETPLIASIYYGDLVYSFLIVWYPFGNHAVPHGQPAREFRPCEAGRLVELALRACSYPMSVPHRFSGVGRPVPTGLVPLAYLIYHH